MDAITPELLARIQFAFTITFHIIFPAISIGLAAYLAVLQSLWVITRRDTFINLYLYWLKPFALVFGMGVVSGVVMSYQFGTNWGRFADLTGPVLGPLMGYEVMSAFFLEAGFLGIMLFGRQRVSERMHLFATITVAVGTTASAFWILSVNSWMHTPAGYSINALGQFVPEDWWAIVFNPSFPYRLVHMVLAAYLTTSFVVGGWAAWHLLRGRASDETRTALSMAMWMAALVAPVQVVAGDAHGLNTLEHQPLKIAAIEGHYHTARGVPLILFGLPNSDAARVDYAIEIPHGASLILTHELDGEIRGLTDWPRADWPNVTIVFFSFRIMVGLGMAMVGVGLLSLWLRLRGTLHTRRWFHRTVLAMAPSGLIALLAGWFTTEIGRQPYTVYGLLRTAESLSPIGLPAVTLSLLAFVISYLLVFGAGIFYLFRTLRRPPSVIDAGDVESRNVKGYALHSARS